MSRGRGSVLVVVVVFFRFGIFLSHLIHVFFADLLRIRQNHINGKVKGVYAHSVQLSANLIEMQFGVWFAWLFEIIFVIIFFLARPLDKRLRNIAGTYETYSRRIRFSVIAY